MTPDFRSRAMAKQAWLARRSEPRHGLLLGLTAGGAIGCLAAFAVLSVIPSHMPAREPASLTVRAERPPLGDAAAGPSSETKIKSTSDGSSADRGAAQIPGRQPIGAAPATPFATAAVAPPRTGPANPDAVSSGVLANHVPPVTAAEPPVTRSLTEHPVLAQGEETKQKARIVRKKKKVAVAPPQVPAATRWAG